MQWACLLLLFFKCKMLNFLSSPEMLIFCSVCVFKPMHLHNASSVYSTNTCSFGALKCMQKAAVLSLCSNYEHNHNNIITKFCLQELDLIAVLL